MFRDCILLASFSILKAWGSSILAGKSLGVCDRVWPLWKFARVFVF